MFTFGHVVSELISHVQQAGKQHRLVVPLARPPFSLIEWLAAQPLFPKCYWQARDGEEEVVALGQIHTFVEPGPAYAILSPGQRVWGGRSFDGESNKSPRCMPSFFFLPQVELIRRGEEWQIVVNIADDRQRTLDALAQLVNDIPALPVMDAAIVATEHTPKQAQWDDLVAKVLRGIEQNQFKKVVLARQTCAQLDKPIHAAQLLASSTLNNHHSFHFMLCCDEQHAFLGSTPERLYVRHQGELHTEALAGTIGRGDNASQDLVLANWLSQDEKNLNENQYVVDDIIECLSPLAERIQIDQVAKLVRLRKVQHLKREITAELKSGVHGTHLLAALQPTAAVCGLPRQAAMDFIINHEPFSRGWYAGSIGYISHEKAEFCVAIRSALVTGSQVRFFAGAGIVPGSQADLEWAELDKKVSTLMSLISEPSPYGVAS